MGLWDSICSGISSVCSAVCSAISNVCSAIGGALSSAMSTLGGLASDIVKELKGVSGLELVTTIALAIVVIDKICEALGLTTKDEPKKLGKKAHVYAQKVENGELENKEFKDTEEFIDYLNKEIELDEEEFEKMSTEEKLGYSAVGLALQVKAIAEKLEGAVLTPQSLATLTKLENAQLFDVGEFLTVVKQGISPQDYSDYLEGRGTKRMQTSEALQTALGSGAMDRLLLQRGAVHKHD